MSRDLADLHPDMHVKVSGWLAAAKTEGHDVLVYCTARAENEQAALYVRGRTAGQIESTCARLIAIGHPHGAHLLRAFPPAPGEQIVTNAPPGLSYHNPFEVEGARGAFAVDFVTLIGGRPQWLDATLYQKVARLAEEVGLEWAGRWKSFRETAHLQLDHPGLVELRARIKLWRGTA